MNTISIDTIRAWHRMYSRYGALVIASTYKAAMEISGDGKHIPPSAIVFQGRGHLGSLRSEPLAIVVADFRDMRFKRAVAAWLRGMPWHSVRGYVYDDYTTAASDGESGSPTITHGSRELADLLWPAHTKTAGRWVGGLPFDIKTVGGFEPNEAQVRFHETGESPLGVVRSCCADLDIFMGGQEELDAIASPEKTEGERLYDFFMTSEHDRVRPFQSESAHPEVRPALPYLMARLADGERLTGLTPREHSDLSSSYHGRGMSSVYRSDCHSNGTFSAWLAKE